ncbi:hypothetical protein [Weizmannia acidilactici]|uniref:hypothetical protein n=1 Tax=Weizmannia acidilactici TaxID=2607726 RepID=UPI001285A6D3|nr:hypothetical protein [Weizmannia acidilactici]GER74220.1 hypothetical protein BpPP18_22870 [Weizmannia acidilactici]
MEADHVEGLMLAPAIVTDDTMTKQNQVMLRLQYSDATIYGLKITKVLQTSEGPVTVHMNAAGPIHLKNMKVDVTKAEFSGIYAPDKLDGIGMKDVRLVAHQQLAGIADLPNLDVTMENGAANIDTSSSDEETLRKIADQLTELLKSGGGTEQKDVKTKSDASGNKGSGKTPDQSKDSTPDTEKAKSDHSAKQTENHSEEKSSSEASRSSAQSGQDGGNLGANVQQKEGSSSENQERTALFCFIETNWRLHQRFF